MSAKSTLFLAHSFASERMDCAGEFNSAGVSDLEIARRICQRIDTSSHGQIEVISTRDPLREYISLKVRREISRSDFVLCVFTKRVKDHLTMQWLPSTYVISEGAYASSQFGSEDQCKQRLFGLLEEGVDRSQLGLGFHGDKTVIGFRRDNLKALDRSIDRLVEQILQPSPKPRDAREYLSLEKTVTVWRSGAVLIECRHRFRFTKEFRNVSIPHTIWRISQALPNFAGLERNTPGPNATFLRCIPTFCGGQDVSKCQCEIRNAAKSVRGNEVSFTVDFDNVGVQPGDEIAYELAWGYPHAFHDPARLERSHPNSVGLRTGDHGPVQNVSLILKFERNWETEEPFRIFECLPQVFTIDATHLPSATDPVTYWHQNDSWKEAGQMERCGRICGTLFDVYQWSCQDFIGMAKVTWDPCFNYFFGEVGPDDAESGDLKQQRPTSNLVRH